MTMGFNSQPPEGGWGLPVKLHVAKIRHDVRFNSQPPEGGWSIRL
jgi:hypothetical protein